MTIKKIDTGNASIAEIASLMENDAFNLETLTLDQTNWPDAFPYKPVVNVKIAHNGLEMLLHFSVKEKNTMAKVRQDNGQVWTDSCCECFLSFDDSGYYNLEVNCIGTALFAYRETKENATHAPTEIMNTIRRYASLGTNPFDEIKGDNNWTLTIAIPAKTFFAHKIQSFEEAEAKINIYKCGDNLSEPHFVSLFPIKTEKPNFHVPAFFKTAHFE
ncbi:MAG: carbohydrate-binding family 9-like protein [Bacteroidales bacterium]